MVDRPDIDYARAASLFDVVARVANVLPAYTALSSVAAGELKEMNEECQQYLNDLGQERLAQEQAAAAELAEENRKETERQRKANDEVAARTAASRTGFTPLPGEPVPDAVRERAKENQKAAASNDTTLVDRRA